MLDPHGLHPLALSYCIFVKKRVPSDAIVRPAIQRNAMGDPTSKCAAMHGDQRLCWDSSTVRQSLRRQTLSDLGDDLKEQEGAGGGGRIRTYEKASGLRSYGHGTHGDLNRTQQ